MGLQRTPPPRAQNESEPDAGQSGSRPSNSTVGETSLPSPARAFQPRNPRVMRSPLSGSTTTGPDPPSETHQREMDIVDPDVSTTPRTVPPFQTHLQQEQEVESRDEDQIETSVQATTSSTKQEAETRDPITPMPASKRRKSRHTVASSDETPVSRSNETLVDVDVDGIETELSQYEKNALYGKRYQVMMDTLELAIKASSEKWSLSQFTECFPKFAAQNRDLFTNLWDEHRAKMKEDLWRESTMLIEARKFGPALRRIEDAVQEAKENGTEEGRSNAWRPDLNVKTVAAATNLPIHDSTYARLRQEYLQLHQDCTERYTAIADKQALLKELESTVSDGVVDLDKTIKLLDGFPSDEMVKWMESVLPSLPASRA